MQRQFKARLIGTCLSITPTFKRLAIYSKWSKTGFHSEPSVDTGTSGIMPGSHLCIICGFFFCLFSFLTKIQYTFSVLTSVSYSLERMMYNSVAECLPSIHRGLGLIPNTTRMKSKTIEFFGIFHLTNSVTLNTQSLPMLLEPHW